MTLHALIMAGGSGTRFWPLSRQRRPKQFLPLASDRPLIEDTARRLAGLVPPSRLRVVCGKLHAPAVRKLLRRVPARNVIVEPDARNTAPAIALGVAHLAAEDPAGVVACLPADHHIADPAAFREALSRAAALAEEGFIVTLGIRPTRPDTGFGYIKAGEPLPGGGARVERFVEKPSREVAESYLRSGDYLWNGGIFVFRADRMREAFDRHAPEIGRAMERIARVVGTRRYARELPRAFAAMPAISIDHAVAEKSKNIAVLPGDFGWSDVGSFDALAEIRPPDGDGNVAVGDGALLIGSRDCTVVSSGRTVAVVGMRDAVVIDAGDAVLVVPRGQSQEVRRVVEALKASRRTALL